MFPKHFEIRIRTFVSVFSVRKCRLSPRQGNHHKQISTLRYNIDCKKIVSFLFKVLNCGRMGKTHVSKSVRNQNLDFPEYI